MNERLRPEPAEGGAEGLRHDLAAASPPGGVEAERALRVARSSCTILITGETGCGKGHLARWIHEHSPRRQHPFVPVNCGAIPDSIIDSHLFGHARGSFTGADRDHPGMIRAAAGGTLLLDEVSQLPLTAQVRLLRLLQEHEAHPVGYTRPVTVNVRVIAASNVDLRDAVAAGRFRADLMYRLDVVRLPMLALRDRVRELPGLLARFNHEFAALHGRDPLEFTADALALLRRCQWPGNVRQLRALVERLHVLCPATIVTPERLSTYGDLRRQDQRGPAGDLSLDRLRLEHVRHLLAQSDGSIRRVAATLGVHRSTLYRWMREHQP
jgi:DNA-binding NtrC family response regulator